MSIEEAKAYLRNYKYDNEVSEAILVVLEKLEELEKITCLRCEDGTPAYCEKCFQEVIGWNAKLQGELNDENLKCAEFAMENYILKDKLRYKDLYG